MRGPPLRRRIRQAFSALALCGLVTIGGSTSAHEPGVQPSAWPEVLTLEEAARFLRVEPQELEPLAQRGEVPARRIGAHWRFARQALLDWLAGVDRAQPLTENVLSTTAARGVTVAQGEEPSPPSGEEAPEEPIGEAPEERTAEEVFLRAQRVLLAPGEVNVDLGLFYSESDDRELVLVDGGTELATVEANAFTTVLIGRYGLLEETELFASTSYSHQEAGVFLGSREITGSSRTEFGDVGLGVRHTVLHEGPGIPDVIVTLDGRIPTGDTSYAAGGGLALVKSVDPAVLFANANYRHTFSRDFADVTRLEPGDRIDATLGYALALNDTLTISTAVSGLFTGATSFESVELRQRERFSLQFGLTSWLAEGLYIEPSVSFGLNGPGDSFVLGVSVPYTVTP